MRYYTESATLFIRGSFRAASTGINGGIRSVSTLLNHSVRIDRIPFRPMRKISSYRCRCRYRGGLFRTPDNRFGQPGRRVPVRFYHGLHHRRDTPRAARRAGAIHILVTSSEGMSDAALLETIVVATEAKTEALLALGLPLTGTPADAVITACEGEERHRSSPAA